MKEGWVNSKLSSLTTKIRSGATPRGGQAAYKKSGISLIRSMNVYDSGFRAKKLAFIDDSQAKKLNNVEIYKADVLINITGASVARCCIVEPSILPARVNQHVSILRPEQEKIHSRYLHYFLTSPEAKKTLLGIGEQGATRQAITKAQLQDFEIWHPKSTSEQEEIVEVLDKAFAAIDQAKANIEQNIANAKELFQSKLNQIFSQKGDGWVEKTLGEVCETFQYGTSSKSSAEGDVPVLRMGNIQDGGLLWDNLKYSTDKDEIAKYLLEKNDVLFNRTNSPELVGKSAIYLGEYPAIHAGYLIRLQPKTEQLDAAFLNFYLNSPKAREYGYSVMISSVNQANINATKLKGYSITTPSIKIQLKCVNELESLKDKISGALHHYQTKLTSLEELKKSILQKAFAGELT